MEAAKLKAVQTLPQVKVTRVQFHNGILFKGATKNSMDALQDKAEMQLHPLGVKIRYNGRTKLVMASVIHWADLEDDNDSKAG